MLSTSYQSGIFQSTRPLRDGTATGTFTLTDAKFQSTRPLRDGTFRMAFTFTAMPNFNPPAPCGTGREKWAQRRADWIFQSTRPLRDGTKTAAQAAQTAAISIHPPLAGRDQQRQGDGKAEHGISIHPPLAGRDGQCRGRAVTASTHFNPPAPCGTGPGPAHCLSNQSYFNPPAPCGTGLAVLISAILITANFNPPAPCGTGHRNKSEQYGFTVFQSTRPLRDGTPWIR